LYNIKKQASYSVWLAQVQGQPLFQLIAYYIFIKADWAVEFLVSHRLGNYSPEKYPHLREMKMMGVVVSNYTVLL
jgi:hypothetical protein